MPLRLVRIIVNPISGRGQDHAFVESVVRHLSLRRFSTQVVRTEGPGHARQLAKSTPADAHCVVSIGGDGTHREVLSGLAGRAVPACVVPSGTENVLARTFGLTGTLREAVNLVQNGRPVALDTGLANGNPFIMFSGIGFDAAVTQDVHARRRGPISRHTYYRPLARLWWRYGFPALRVTVDGHVLADDAGFVLVANTPLYANRLRIAARAVPDDGLLDVVCYRTRSRWQILRLFFRTMRGRHLDHPQVAYARGERIQVTCPERVVPVQVDGDATLSTPVAYTVRQRGLLLLVPRKPPG